MGVVCKMYVNENRANSFPTLQYVACAVGQYGSVAGDTPVGSAYRAGFSINMCQLYPEYLTDAAVTLCPSSVGGTNVAKKYTDANGLTQVFDGKGLVNTSGPQNRDFYPCESGVRTNSYIYFGWALFLAGVTDSSDQMAVGSDLSTQTGQIAAAAAFVGSHAIDAADGAAWIAGIATIQGFMGAPQTLANRQQLDKDQKMGSPTRLTVYRLREGIERFFITDINNPGATTQAQSSISIMADWNGTGGGKMFNHLPGGSNVLYMDGHVEFLKYPNIWPVSPLLAVITGGSMLESGMA